MAAKVWNLDTGTPEGHLLLEDGPSRMKEIKDHAATAGGLYAEAQTIPDRTVAIYEGVVYFGTTKVEYTGLDIADMGPAGAFEVTAMTVNYFNKILFTIDSAGILAATEGTPAATAPAVTPPAIPQNKFPVCMVTVQDDGTGTTGTILTIEQGEIQQLQGFGRILEMLDEDNMASNSATKTISQQSLLAYLGTNGSVPIGEKILFYKNTAVTGYSLLNTLDNKVVYVTKGSVAGGQTGGAVHSAGTWTQPNHLHTTGSHSLSIAELAAHTHTVPRYATAGGASSFHINTSTGTTSNQPTSSTGSGTAHNHGNSGNSATANTWRPAAYNFTMQQRI